MVFFSLYMYMHSALRPTSRSQHSEQTVHW